MICIIVVKTLSQNTKLIQSRDTSSSSDEEEDYYYDENQVDGRVFNEHDHFEVHDGDNRNQYNIN